MKILVSSCLLGVSCRWHGKKLYLSTFVKNYLKENPDTETISVCPEALGGLLTPRPPVKRLKGKVFETCENKADRKKVTGKDVTEYFVNGAKEILKIALSKKIKLAILCKWSPSCDKGGITGKLLIATDIEVVNTW